MLIHLLLYSKYGEKMTETQYASIIARGIAGEKINSIKSIVRHQGGPSANVLESSIKPDSHGNYDMQILTDARYSKSLAEGIGLSGYASYVSKIGASGVNRDYDIFMSG
jgi:hypothetical protein